MAPINFGEAYTEIKEMADFIWKEGNMTGK